MESRHKSLSDFEYHVLSEFVLLPVIREYATDVNTQDFREINEVDLAQSLSVPEADIKAALGQLLEKGLIMVDIDTRPRKKIMVTPKGWNILTDHMIDDALGGVFEPELKSQIAQFAEKRGVKFDGACIILLQTGIKVEEAD